MIYCLIDSESWVFVRHYYYTVTSSNRTFALRSAFYFQSNLQFSLSWHSPVVQAPSPQFIKSSNRLATPGPLPQASHWLTEVAPGLAAIATKNREFSRPWIPLWCRTRRGNGQRCSWHIPRGRKKRLDTTMFVWAQVDQGITRPVPFIRRACISLFNSRFIPAKGHPFVQSAQVGPEACGFASFSYIDMEIQLKGVAM